MRLGHDVRRWRTDEVLKSGYGPGHAARRQPAERLRPGRGGSVARELDGGRGDRIEHDDEFHADDDEMESSPTLFGNARRASSPPLLEHEWPAAARRMHEFFAGASGRRLHDVQRLADARASATSGSAPSAIRRSMLRPPGPVAGTPSPDGLEIPQR